jgi:hypothetical protein
MRRHRCVGAGVSAPVCRRRCVGAGVSAPVCRRRIDRCGCREVPAPKKHRCELRERAGNPSRILPPPHLASRRRHTGADTPAPTHRRRHTSADTPAPTHRRRIQVDYSLLWQTRTLGVTRFRFPVGRIFVVFVNRDEFEHLRASAS